MLAGALGSQQAAQAAQAQQWGQLGNTLGQFGLIGADMYANSGPGTSTRPFSNFGGGSGGGMDYGPER